MVLAPSLYSSYLVTSDLMVLAPSLYSSYLVTSDLMVLAPSLYSSYLVTLTCPCSAASCTGVPPKLSRSDTNPPWSRIHSRQATYTCGRHTHTYQLIPISNIDKAQEHIIIPSKAIIRHDYWLLVAIYTLHYSWLHIPGIGEPLYGLYLFRGNG